MTRAEMHRAAKAKDKQARAVPNTGTSASTPTQAPAETNTAMLGMNAGNMLRSASDQRAASKMGIGSWNTWKSGKSALGGRELLCPGTS